jgi:hypothetical protein
MTINLLFLGELDIHASSLLPFLSSHDYDVTVVNTSHHAFPRKIYGTDIPSYNLYEKSGIRFLFRGRLEWFRKSILYNLTRTNGELADKVKQIVRQKGIDVVYGSWGSHSLPEIRLIQRKFNIPTIYEFLTYPVNLFKPAVKIEDFFNRSAITNLTGRILATKRMLNYMKRVFGALYGKNIVFLECYPKDFFYRKRLSTLSNRNGEPHLIFIGSDFHSIFPQIIEM